MRRAKEKNPPEMVSDGLKESSQSVQQVPLVSNVFIVSSSFKTPPCSAGDTKPQSLPSFIFHRAALFDFCVFLQGEAERASAGEAEAGGENHGPVQGSGSQHAPSSQQGQVTYLSIPLLTVYSQPS